MTTHTHRHTQVSYLALWLQAVGVQGSARRDWYLNCLWSAAAHQFRLKWGRRSSWPNPNPLLSLPVIASVCLLIAHIIFKDPDIGLPSIRSKAAAAESCETTTKVKCQNASSESVENLIWINLNRISCLVMVNSAHRKMLKKKHTLFLLSSFFKFVCWDGVRKPSSEAYPRDREKRR